ncbi:TatD DNase family protein [Paenibacillus methanolicus]|uniref:TatD DNase family protein n=2 Tax=Paenibacillus methanolicus TaxID=582686 RepID=A0A5S5CEZ8_9BACL|nr:TatD DNase family protein [Paenibacillus methanolicus]
MDNKINAQSLYIDAHLHVDHYETAEQRPLLEEAFREGVAAVVAVSMHLNSSRTVREWAMRMPERVMPAYGYHPEQPLPADEELEELFAWMRARDTAGERFAVGEVGLPYYMRTETESSGTAFDESGYMDLLEKFVRFAAETGRPIVLHAVYEDADKALDLLEMHRVTRAHFHWFKGAAATVERMIALGCVVSVTPDVLYEPEIRTLVRAYPLALLMTETDGPWPFEGPFAGRATKPGMVRDVANEIAAIKGIRPEEAAEALYRNAVRFYGL